MGSSVIVPTTTCGFVLKQCSVTGFQLYCVAEADESGFCPMHRGGVRVSASKQSVNGDRDHDRDLLPWSEDDRQCFAAAEMNRR